MLHNNNKKKYEIEIHDHDLVHDNTAIKIWKIAEI